MLLAVVWGSWVAPPFFAGRRSRSLLRLFFSCLWTKWSSDAIGFQHKRSLTVSSSAPHFSSSRRAQRVSFGAQDFRLWKSFHFVRSHYLQHTRLNGIINPAARLCLSRTVNTTTQKQRGDDLVGSVCSASCVDAMEPAQTTLFCRLIRKASVALTLLDE